MSSVVLDASAVLAVLFAEQGADAVIPTLTNSFLSTVNLAEVTTRAVDQGRSLEDALHDISRLPLHIVDFDAGQAHISSSLRSATKPLGLSLGDRACLALGLARQLPVVTADREWAKLNLNMEIIIFR